MLAPRKERDLKSARGTMGDGALVSIIKKMASARQPAIKLPDTSRFLQPNLADSRNPVTTPASPAVANNAPNQSTCFTLEPRLSGTWRSEIVITATASGTFSRKAHRQDAYWISHPPSTGPKAVVIAVKPDHVPIALPRESSSKQAVIIARLPGTSNAAPIPCMQRA